MNSGEPTSILQVKDITKKFPGVVANDKVSLSVEQGEIHAIVGENGAGKTTLMKIVGGLYQPDNGEIILNGESQQFDSALDAFTSGIAMVHQEFMLVKSLSVLENIVMGFEPKKTLGFLDRKKARNKAHELAQKYGLKVPLDATVTTLPVAVRQQVEIVKALFKDTKILILDEPTAVLTPQESKDLYAALQRLNELGTTIIFITHKLNEVMEVADRVTVLRQGVVQGTLPISEVNRATLAEMMVGREVVFRVKKEYEKHEAAAPALEVDQVGLSEEERHWKLRNVGFTVHKGEIVGLAGVAGNGQAELVEIITGLRKPTTGTITIKGKQFAFVSTKEYRKAASYVPQDRQEIGCSPAQSIWENVIIGRQNSEQFSHRGILKRKAILQHTRSVVDEYDVRTPSVFVNTGNLSGGNLQKLILGRELSKQPDFLLAQDPTRGLDVGATEFIRNQIIDFTARGNGVLLVSQELDELLMLSDRILVIFEGRLVGEITGEEATPELVGSYMMGLKSDEGANSE
jgi:general nucleoside transport system ATP-binding protein